MCIQILPYLQAHSKACKYHERNGKPSTLALKGPIQTGYMPNEGHVTLGNKRASMRSEIHPEDRYGKTNEASFLITL